MKSLKTYLSMSLISIVSAAGLSACGQQAYHEQLGSTAGASTSGTGSTGGTAGTTSTPTVLPTSTPTPSNPPLTYAFSITGSGNYATPAVNTDNVLKVRITAGAAGLVSGTGFSANYNCVQYTVSALGQSVQTQVLAVTQGAWDCPNAPTYQDIDMSARLQPGHNAVTVTVSNVEEDYKYISCVQSPWLYNAYPYGPYSCQTYGPVAPIYTTHVAQGSLAIQVNGTTL